MFLLLRRAIVDRFRCILDALIKSNFCKCFGVNKIWQFIKIVPGNPCLNSLKKNASTTFSLFLCTNRLKTINWFMNHSWDILSSGVKSALYLVRFMINLELQLHKATRFFNFWLQLVRRVVKNRARDFSFRFYFLRYWLILHFCFLWNRYQNKEILYNVKTAHFLRNHGHGFARQLFPQMYTAFKGITPKIFELELEHYTLTENPLKRLTHCYCNFNPPTRLNDVWYLWNPWYFS